MVHHISLCLNQLLCPESVGVSRRLSDSHLFLSALCFRRLCSSRRVGRPPPDSKQSELFGVKKKNSVFRDQWEPAQRLMDELHDEAVLWMTGSQLSMGAGNDPGFHFSDK